MRSPNSKTNHRYELALVCTMMVLYAFCFQIQSPLEPFLVEKLVTEAHASSNSTLHPQGDENSIATSQIQISFAEKYAKLKSLFSVAQCICSFCFGLILDKWGVKTGLIINFIACTLSYSLLYVSTSVQILYLSKIPGIAMAGYLCAQAAVVKLTSPGSERIRWLGLITTAYTIGGTIGPYLGGILGSSGDYYISALYASAGSVFCLFLTFLLPSSWLSRPQPQTGQPFDDKASQQSSETKANKGNLFSKVSYLLSVCGFLMMIKVVTCIVNSMANFSQPLVFKSFGVKEQTMGRILGAKFAFGGFTNAFLIGPLTNYLGGKSSKVIERCLFMMALLYLLEYCFFSESINMISRLLQHQTEVLLIFVLSLAVFQYTLAVSNTNKTSEMVSRELQGTYLGIENALFAVGFLIGPQVGFQILQRYQIGGIILTCLFLLAACFVSTIIYFRKRESKEKSQ